MHPYREPEPPLPPTKSSLRAGRLVPFTLGLGAGFSLGPMSVVLALRLAPAPPAARCEAPVPVAPVSEAAEAPGDTDPPTPAEPAEPPAPPAARLSSAQAQASIGNLAARAIKAIASRDLETLASMVDPDRGLELAPYGAGSVHRRLSPAEIRSCFRDPTRRYWGTREEYGNSSGERLFSTCSGYWELFVSNRSYAAATDVTFQVAPNYGADRRAEVQVEGDEAYAQYFVQTPNEEGAEFEALILSFEPRGSAWRLRRISHQSWPEGE